MTQRPAPRVIGIDAPQDPDPEARRIRLGGKGAGLVTMAHELGLPVPPAFVITTDVCRSYFEAGWPDGLDEELRAAMTRLEAATGRRFGDPADPLLVSVRSGAPVSMPGMMDTILDLGLNEATTAGLARVSGDEAFAATCRDRFLTSFREIVGVEHVPDDPWTQLRAAAEAVFRSWQGDRAVAYRQREGIPDDLGTAVTVQAMVFGNRGQDSGTGVLFTRDPATGVDTPFGDVLFDAQGEDVVAGTHHTEPITVLDERLPSVADELRRYAASIERHLRDCADIEFTIEDGRLWLLQARVGKRSPQAALRMAVEMAEDPAFPLTREEAVRRVSSILADPPRLAGRVTDRPVVTTGVPASPGLATGEVVTACDRAIAIADKGRPVLLVRPSTAPDDVAAMARSVGILTTSGGPASHAAVVARGWGIPAVVGAADVTIDGSTVRLGDHDVREGDTITIDGTTGEVYLGSVEQAGTTAPEVATLSAWAAAAGIAIGGPGDGSGPDGGRGHDDSPTELPLAQVGEEPVDASLVLRTLAIKGYATEDALAEGLLVEADAVRPHLEGLIAAGNAEAAAGAYRLTAAGKRAAEAAIGEDRTSWGLPAAEAALDGFLGLDQRMKEIVTAWQTRTVDGQQVLNDHADAAYDTDVLARLSELHGDTVAWLLPHAQALPRLGRYRQRLDRAIAGVDAGDHRFVASPRVDSVHGTWFELHEDLIRLAGRRREDEVAAGRA